MKQLSRSNAKVKCHLNLVTSGEITTHIPTKLHQLLISSFLKNITFKVRGQGLICPLIFHLHSQLRYVALVAV